MRRKVNRARGSRRFMRVYCSQPCPFVKFCNILQLAYVSDFALQKLVNLCWRPGPFAGVRSQVAQVFLAK